MNNFTPEHLHLALNHVPFLGAGFAAIPLIVGFITRSKHAAVAGLLIATISGWMTPFVMYTGEAAYERYEDGPIARYLDPQAEHFLEIHEHRAEAWSKIMYASAILSTAGLVLLMRKPAWISRITAVALTLCLMSFFAGIWIAESGGLIRRPDFRADQPAKAHDQHLHDEDDSH